MNQLMILGTEVVVRPYHSSKKYNLRAKKNHQEGLKNLRSV